MDRFKEMKNELFKAIPDPVRVGLSNNWLKMHGIPKHAWKQLDKAELKSMRCKYLNYHIGLILEEQEHIEHCREKMQHCNELEYDFFYSELCNSYEHIACYRVELVRLGYSPEEIDRELAYA